MNASSSAADAPAAQPAVVWSAPARWLASLLLVYHLMAVLIEPISLPPSILGDGLRPYFQSYIAATFLGHAYKFFAPDPGPSHIVRYEVTLADGSTRHGTLPDRQQHWPRLLYHRHFMLTEFIDDGRPAAVWESLPPGATPPPAPPWRQRFINSYAEHLLAGDQAREVKLYYRIHLIPTPGDVNDGMRLDDPSLYRERQLGAWRRSGS